MESSVPPDPRPRRTGRRAGRTVSDQRILRTARRQFGRHGYEGVTMRTIAQEAGVDSALIHHFFLTKEGLFEAAVGGVLGPADLVERVTGGPRATCGERMVRELITHWDDPANRVRLIGLLRSVTAVDVGTVEVQAFLGAAVCVPVAACLGGRGRPLRAAMAGACLVGLATSRYVFQLPPLATLPPDELARWAGPMVQMHLAGGR